MKEIDFEMEKDLESSFLEEIRKDYTKAFSLYRALCNNFWTKEGRTFSFTWRSAAETVANIRIRGACPAEDYMDYYLSRGEGECDPWLEDRLRFLGYTKVPFRI